MIKIVCDMSQIVMSSSTYSDRGGIGIGSSLSTHGRTKGCTDKHGCRNRYLD